VTAAADERSSNQGHGVALLAYDLIRLMMAQSALLVDRLPRQLSSFGSLGAATPPEPNTTTRFMDCLPVYIQASIFRPHETIAVPR